MLKIRAYGKINLTLEVDGLRNDGFHEVRSIMQSIELSDVLQLEKREDNEITLTGSVDNLDYGKENLVVKAALLLRKESGSLQGATMYLEKNIPIAAGLGGGSADCAAALIGLNQLWDLGYTLGELVVLGGSLGSDVPFCLINGTCMARGRGEEITPIKGPSKEELLIIKPNFGVSTKEIYQGLDSLGFLGKTFYSENMAAQLKKGLEYKDFLYNDLEKVTTSLYPEVGYLLEELKKYSQYVLMSGSGPTVLGFFQKKDLEMLEKKFKERFKAVYRTRLK